MNAVVWDRGPRVYFYSNLSLEVRKNSIDLKIWDQKAEIRNFSGKLLFFWLGTHEAHTWGTFVDDIAKKSPFSNDGRFVWWGIRTLIFGTRDVHYPDYAPLKGNCDSTHRGSPMLYRHQQICPILGDVSKIWNFPNLQKTPESSQNELCGWARVQNGSPESTDSKKSIF